MKSVTSASHGGGSSKHHASVKHAGVTHKHGHARSAKQIAAEKKWQEAGAKARHQHAVAAHASHQAPKKLSLYSGVSCCSATALAASLKLTGAAVSDADIFSLYFRTASDPDAGASILATLEAAQEHGLAGFYPLFSPAGEMRDGVVLGRDLKGGPHAVTLDCHGAWSWDRWYPVSDDFLAGADQAWEITWLS